MSSGSRGARGSVTNSTSKSGSNKTVAHSENATTNSTAAEKAAKAAPTPEQIRLAQIIDTTQASQVDRALQEKIDQLMVITGKNSEEAHILLHDHANDLAAAVNAIFEGGSNTEAWHERTKKKKPKAKGELENNKENRRGGSAGPSENNRERSGSRPRGGGRGGQSSSRGSRRDGDASGSVGGRGGPGRRGGGRGMANGGGPPGVGRGRGARSIRGGRGGAAGTAPHIPNDTFHTNRQNLATFDEAIDTWGEAITSEHQSTGQDSYADPNTVGILEDWGEEWQGSLNETNVFVPSSVGPTPPPASDLTAIDAAKLVNSSPILQQQNSYHHQQMDEQQQQMGSVSVGAASPGTHQSYSAVANSTSSVHSLSGPAGVLMPNSQHSAAAMDLAALLQQAAPQSQLSGLGTNSSLLANASASTNGSLSHLQQQTPNILGGISTNMGDVIKASSSSSASVGGGGGSSSLGVGAGVSYAASPQTVVSSMSHYSSVAPQHTSIFATSLQNSVSRSLGNSLSSSNSSGINSNSNSVSSSKPGVIMPGMMPPATGQSQRPKQTRPRPQPTSKIPQSAVEMPEDAMSAINMQLTGLKFGSEGFDFMAEPNKSMQPTSSLSMSNDTSYPSTNVSSSSYTNSVAYPPPPSVNASGSSTPSYGGGVSAPSAASSAVSAASYVNSSYHNSGYGGSAQSSSPLNSYDRSASSNQQHNSYSSSAGNNVISSALAAADRSDASQKAGLSQNQNSSYSNNNQDVSSSNSGSNSSSANYNSNSGSGGHSSSMSSNTGVSGSDNSGVVSSSTGANSYGSATGYSQQQQQQSSSSVPGGGASQQQQYHSSPTSTSQSAASVQYQNNYNSSSHSSLSAISSKQLTPLKEPPQVSYSSESVGVSSSVSSNNSNNSGSVSSSNFSSLQAAAVAASQQQQMQQHTQHKPSPTSVPPPGVHQQQQHHQQPSSHLAQQHQAAAVAQQQMLVQQQQQQQHQFVNNNAAALQAGTMPFFPSLQPQIYSYDELQLLQQRMQHIPQQVPSTLAGSRDASSLNAAAYSAADVAKFRNEQNSSPVPSAINTQGGHAGAYLTNAGNAAAMHPMYMYQNVVPNSFPQYAAPAIIQLPPNTGSSSSQFQPAPKLQYNAAAGPAYYDSQGGGDYKGGYGSSSQGQSKPGVASNTGSMTSTMSDLPPYKNHLTKSYEKSGGFHTSTPPPFSLPGSAGAPYAHAQVFLPAMPQAQHHSTLMHHQLHQDGSSSGGQRGGSSGGQNKGASKPYQNQFWSNS